MHTINIGYIVLNERGDVFLEHDGKRYGPFESADCAVQARVAGLALMQTLGVPEEKLGEAFAPRPELPHFDLTSSLLHAPPEGSTRQ